MTRLFLGGSRHVTRLPGLVLDRLAALLEGAPAVLIGDAAGADAALQHVLHARGYRRVEIFCSDGLCRHNLGNWPVRAVPTGRRTRDAQFYAVKDRAMAEAATDGLMVWDGRSPGTIGNARRLVAQDKPVMICTVPELRWDDLRDAASWQAFLARQDPGLRRLLNDRAGLEPAAPGASAQAMLAI